MHAQLRGRLYLDPALHTREGPTGIRQHVAGALAFLQCSGDGKIAVVRGDLERVCEQDVRLSPACAEYARELLPVSRPKRHVVYEAKETRDHHRQPAIVQKAALRAGPTNG